MTDFDLLPDTDDHPIDSIPDVFRSYHLRQRHFKHKNISFIKPRPHKGKDFFCDWDPKLFGIDEDEIPYSEDEEGLFDIDWSDLQQEGLALTKSQLDGFRVGSRQTLTDDELREAWIRDQRPRYTRRTRQKQIYRKENGEPFECTCAVDWHYYRHYVPHFGGGTTKEEELRVPHFRAFWEDFKQHGELGGEDCPSRILREEPHKKTTALPRIKLKDCTPVKIRKFKQELLSRFRPLTCREVRRYRMSYAEALYLELEEDDYLNAAAFFKHLIVKDHFVHQDTSSDTRLRDHKPFMNKIYELLKMGERFEQKKHYHLETYLYLRSGVYFNDYGSKWWWLTEEFYAKAVKVSSNSVIDGGKSEATANYIFGTFLLDCVRRVNSAQEHLLRARELSIGKDWSARTILPTHQGTIHKECGSYLCRALIETSRELRKQGKPEEALPLIHRTYKLCHELGSTETEIMMNTYLELGLIYQEVGFLDWAKVAFGRFIEISEIRSKDECICHGYLELAICSRREDDLERCYRNLSSYLKAAKKRNNVNLKAFGDRYFGEFHLHLGEPTRAADYFLNSFNSFYAQYQQCEEIPFEQWEPKHYTLRDDFELTRVLAGLAIGEILKTPIFTLLDQLVEKTKKKKILQLITWKTLAHKMPWREAIKKMTEDLYRIAPPRPKQIKSPEYPDAVLSCPKDS